MERMMTKKPVTRIDRCFQTLRQARQKGFVAYLTAGDPDLDATYEQVLMMERAGVAIVELGIPFSDPLADGRVNQESAARALAGGTTLDGVFELVERLRRCSEMPLLFYCYMNLLYAPGFEATVRRAADCGVDGLLILDLPAEENGDYSAVLREAGVNQITLITPTSPVERIKKIVRPASGFVYAVSRTGVTGVQNALGPEAGDLLARARTVTKLPLALGFGISNPDQAAAAARDADAVVVGSALVQRLHEAGRSPTALQRVEDWVRAMVDRVKER
jgi:tryptophan synthase alpha chain